MEHQFENLQECPSCASSNFQVYLSCKDFTYSQSRFNIVKCDNCKLLFTNPRPSESAIGPYYDSPEYVSHTDTKEGLLFQIYGAVKKYSLKQKRKLLASLTNGRNALDYGAGSGDFSKELSLNGWNVSAFEPDAKARNLITSKTHSVKLIDDLSNIDSSSKDIITLWHVLEHIHNLKNTVSQFERILKPGGKLVIAVPNHTSYDAQFYGEDWAAYDVPRHLYHFNLETINTFISQFQLRPTQLTPLWFDSVYVSLLSEKNRNTNNAFSKVIGWIRALVIGFTSNTITIANKKKCSSLTYVYEKHY